MQRHDFTNKQANKEATTSTPARPSLSQRASRHPLHLLQSALGNRAFGRVIQAKLQISQPDDAYEQEADRVAEQVMRMPDAASPEPVIGSTLPQISCLQRKCAQCEEEEIQRQPLEEEREEEEEGTLQAKEAPGQTPEVTPGVQAQINTLRGGGQPLSEPLRAFFEPRFGHDFSQVRVHTDSQAAESARALSARAYTVGSDVVFGAEQYVPHSNEGKRLLAHELTHVIQQEKSPLGAQERRVIHRAVTVDDCDTTQETVIRNSHARAMEMVQNAIDKLDRYDGANPPEVRTALSAHFHGTGTFLAAWIRLNLIELKRMSRSPQYECESVQVGSRRGWSMWCVPFTDIELYPNWFADPDIDMRARTMIHEWVHRYGCNFDLGYFGSEGYEGHSTTRSLLNADPWAWFCVDVR